MTFMEFYLLTIIGHVNEYTHNASDRHTQSMLAYKILTVYFWKFQYKAALWEC